VLCGWRVRGVAGAVVGGLAFILPGLAAIIVLAAVFLSGSAPAAVRGAGAGAGAAVVAVALQAGYDLALPGWRRVAGARRGRWLVEIAAGAVAAALIGPWLVLVLLACGLAELAWQRPHRGPSMTGGAAVHAWPVLPLALVAGGGLGALAWTALKVGALSYGGGFVIVPLMQADAVDVHGWLTSPEFTTAVALGQVTPGPVVHTVAVVGYGAAGVGGALLAAAVAFAPSFVFVLAGGRHFDALRRSPAVRAFLDGAGPAAIGAIAGSAYLLADALTEPWQAAVAVAAGVALLVARRGVVPTLIVAGVVGAVVGG